MSYIVKLQKNYSTKKIVYNHIDDIWSIDLAVFSDYKTSNNKVFRYIFLIIDNFSKYLWAIPPKNKYSQTLTQEFSNILSTSKRSPLKIESDRGSEFYNSIFQNFLRSKNIQHFSQFTYKSPSIAERVIRTMRHLLKKPVFLAGNADWLSELPSVIKQYNDTNHHSTKMTPIQATKFTNEKLVYSNLQNKRRKLNPNLNKDSLFVQLILNESLVKVIRRIGVINYTQLLKSYTTSSLAIELTFYPRDIIKIYYYLLN